MDIPGSRKNILKKSIAVKIHSSAHPDERDYYIRSQWGVVYVNSCQLNKRKMKDNRCPNVICMKLRLLQFRDLCSEVRFKSRALASKCCLHKCWFFFSLFSRIAVVFQSNGGSFFQPPGLGKPPVPTSSLDKY